ncbi:hypothetical protein PVK06_003513 [Gossypium arboreum]|uniref:RNase H type-1 domain-containing protein n=1 Tax=Gossypium arboreum TaxID=29729 RepID=A0ABR0R6N4_GOSAR|nr:hypothetical protein PVK06_003513 [Gossypium arboreum]
MTLEKDEVFRIEARSMLEGLGLAWDKELRAIYKLLLRNWKVRMMLRRNWKVRICHTFRAHNESANFMAKHATIGFTSIKVFSIPPQVVQGLIQKDILNL